MLRSGKYVFDPKMPLPPEGLVIEPVDSCDLTVGVWIMPNNEDVGMLEDFILRLIPDDDSLMPYSKSIVEKLDGEREKHPGLFREVHKAKAKIHTWLAWHHVPGTSLSVAVQKRLFATDKKLCTLFMEWIGRLKSD